MPMAKRSTNSVTSAPTRVEERTASAGFTILELLIVIGVVVSLAAIAIPFTLQELERRTETEATDRLGLLVRLARSEARASGMPMEVMCDQSGTRVMVLRVDPRNPGVVLVSDDPDEFEAGNEIDPERRILNRWATVDFGASIVISPVPVPETTDMEAFEFEASDEFTESVDLATEPGIDPWPGSTRLLFMLPDGSVITTTPFGMTTGRGWKPVLVDPFSGRIDFSEPMPSVIPTTGDESEDPVAEEAVEEDPLDEAAGEADFGRIPAVGDEGARL